MELKKYQQSVISDLRDYLAHLESGQGLSEAFSSFWAARGVTVGGNGMPAYQNLLPGVPHVCYKVPTGGGKTFLACTSVKPIFDALPAKRAQVVVWLVPSDAILEQTLSALRNPEHPYRQRLNLDFGSRVEVYSKQELLEGQNFSPVVVENQLSVMVLSYDSFRSRSKDGRKAYQANGNLTAFRTALGTPERPIEKADETALFQVINQLNPVVIVDESHHARSSLSVDMLRDFNPAFVLDLTATPKKNSNIISFVSAYQLKTEHMVKLPVVAYNRPSQRDVITDAIELRWTLEEAAMTEYELNGRYVRPIVLFQAQPKTSEDATSFEKLKDKLIKAGVPAEEIAIKTANINELKNVDLMSETCPINYIITVNALKEGWDCPFAYILASLANKTSRVDVEQIVGRVLRQPGASDHISPLLNMSYVLTSSNDFQATLRNIVEGLNQAGFSRKDCRVAENLAPSEAESENDETGENDEENLVGAPEVLPIFATCASETAPQSEDGASEDFLNFESAEVAAELEQRRQHIKQAQTKPAASADEHTQPTPPASPSVGHLLTTATQKASDYTQQLQDLDSDSDSLFGATPELQEFMHQQHVRPQFAEDLDKIVLPRFLVSQPQSIFNEHGIPKALTPEDLTEGFTLRGKAYDLDIQSADEDMFRVDIKTAADEQPRAMRMHAQEQKYLRKHIASLPPESRRRNCIDTICMHLNRIDAVENSDLREYVTRVIDNLDGAELTTAEENPFNIALKLKNRIEQFLAQHRMNTFEKWLEISRIVVGTEAASGYKLPKRITPTHPTDLIDGSLYDAEDAMNALEEKFLHRLSALPNIRWWHRVIERKGFCLNGFINHYPDFIICTDSGKIILVETKGEQLKNDDSRRKIKLGEAWTHETPNTFRYYMVFDDHVTPLEGAKTISQTLDIISQL